MAPGLRPLGAAATLTGVLLLTPLPYAAADDTPTPSPPATAVPSRSPNSSPSAQPSPPAASGEQRLAGSRAGEGRTRPGRVPPPHDFPYAPDTELPDAVRPAQQEAVPEMPPQAPVPEPPETPETPEPSQPPATPAPTSAPVRPPNGHRHQAAPAVTSGSDLRYHVLSLGAGLALTGLGLGFLGLRLRRL
ncbi:hypothetical protein [Streptomyces sp. NPDC050485]|uniref:hypothetical protein n=1 Tax=Streptomyces sp. NPDC050485 TaxID=3365617 RepID=UPI00379D872A